MTWSLIITALLELVGPVIADWLKRWLEDRLRAASSHLPEPTSFAHHSAAPAALLDRAISSLPPLAFARKTFLRRLRSASMKRADAILRGDAPAQLSADERTDLREAAGAAANE